MSNTQPLVELRVFAFPYCVKKQNDGTYVLLNRNYKPIGFLTRGRVEYGSVPVRFRFARLTRGQKSKISVAPPDSDDLYLYDDKSVPTRSEENMRNYCERLAYLMRLAVIEPERRS